MNRIRLIVVLILLAALAGGRRPQTARAAQAGEISAQSAPGSPQQRDTLSAGGSHTCGLRADGTLACWGGNDYGQSTPPADVFTAGVFTQGVFTQVSAGFYHTCGLRADGTLACWGLNDYGQSTPPAGVFTQVRAGGLHTCGLRADGTLACWGNDVKGQSTPPAGVFTQVHTGFGHTCGLRADGTLACWGWNDAGQSTPPAGVFTQGVFTQVSAGTYHTCGLRADGTLACWGGNGYGQSTPPTGVFTQVRAGGLHTCGLRTDGTLACWGWNDAGQSTPPAGVFTQVHAGFAHTCGLRADDTLACWGDNDYGQAPRLTLNPAALPEGVMGAVYSQAVGAAGGLEPYAYSLAAGSLPNGLSLDSGSGLISGAPSAAGVYSFTLQASDAFPLPLTPVQQAYTITIDTQADLALTLQAETFPDKTVVYTLQVQNLGPSDASGARVHSQITPFVANISWTCTASSGAACPHAGGADTLDEVLDQLPAGASVTFEIHGKLGSLPTISSFATVSAPDGTTDPVPENNRGVVGQPYHLLLSTIYGPTP